MFTYLLLCLLLVEVWGEGREKNSTSHPRRKTPLTSFAIFKECSLAGVVSQRRSIWEGEVILRVTIHVAKQPLHAASVAFHCCGYGQQAIGHCDVEADAWT